jgi:hypothetical protein
MAADRCSWVYWLARDRTYFILSFFLHFHVLAGVPPMAGVPASLYVRLENQETSLLPSICHGRRLFKAFLDRITRLTEILGGEASPNLRDPLTQYAIRNTQYESIIRVHPVILSASVKSFDFAQHGVCGKFTFFQTFT